MMILCNTVVSTHNSVTLHRTGRKGNRSQTYCCTTDGPVYNAVTVIDLTQVED